MTDALAPKTILFNDDALDKLEEGAKAAHDAISATMGPGGRLVMYEENTENPYPTVTKDGVSVASMIAFDDEAKNMGSQFVIQAARKQVYETGDGTTLTSILTYKIFKEGRKMMAAGFSHNDTIRGMNEAVADAVEEIKSNSVSDITEEVLKNIARISTNNDRVLADLIAEAVSKTGKHGMVFHTRSQNDEHTIEYQEGYQLDIGIQAREFTNVENRLMTLKNPFLLITDQNIYDATKLMPLLKQCKEATAADKKPEIVIIAPQVGSEVLQVMKRNITDTNGHFFMVHIRPSKDLRPEKNKMIMEDLAALTGGMFISQDSGYQIDKLDIGQLGVCDQITSFQEKTIITGKSIKIKKRLEELEGQYEQTEDPYTKDLIEESIAKLNGGIATIMVGGRNLTEQTEVLFRVDDAVKACKSAQEMGYVRGGGVAMLEACRKLAFSRHEAGFKVIHDAMKYPTEVILRNAKNEGWQGIISEILEGNNGYEITNSSTSGVVDMYDMHIIDPTKVIVYALRNAASAAISMLRTSVMIISKGKDNVKSSVSV